MKILKFVTVLLLVLQCFVTSGRSASFFSSSTLDRMDVDQYLQNKSLVEFLIRCVVYNGPCDQTGLEIKRVWPVIGPTRCRGCSTDQKRRFAKLAAHIQRNYPRAWNDLASSLPFG